MKVLILISVMFLAACGSGSGGDSNSKDLFSKWNGPAPLDLTQATFGTGKIFFAITQEQFCSCDIDITGTQNSGTAHVYSCVKINTNYACYNFQDVYTYTKTNNQLGLCDTGNNCEVYQ